MTETLAFSRYSTLRALAIMPFGFFRSRAYTTYALYKLYRGYSPLFVPVIRTRGSRMSYNYVIVRGFVTARSARVGVCFGTPPLEALGSSALDCGLLFLARRVRWFMASCSLHIALQCSTLRFASCAFYNALHFRTSMQYLTVCFLRILQCNACPHFNAVPYGLLRAHLCCCPLWCTWCPFYSA